MGEGKPRQRRRRGEELKQFRAQIREGYEEGATIRALVVQFGGSYGAMRYNLHLSGAVLRPRGGDTRSERVRNA